MKKQVTFKRGDSAKSSAIIEVENEDTEEDLSRADWVMSVKDKERTALVTPSKDEKLAFEPNQV